MNKLRSILLIDDDNIANYLHEVIIENLSITDHLEILNNGLDGINFFNSLCEKDKCPELVLLDLNMPVMDGFEFLKVYQDLEYPQKQNTKIIVLSSSNRLKDIEKAKELGCTDFLIKPMSESKLIEILEKHFYSERETSSKLAN